MGTISLELDALHEGQLKVVSEARRWNVLQCGRRFGKTCLGENRVIETALNGQPAAWFAPTYKLLADVWRHLVWSLKSVTASVNQQEKQLRLITGGIIDCWSLDQPDAGRGRKYKRVVVDEAGIVRLLQESWQEAIRPTLTDLKGDAWLLGTPKGRNFFHRLYARGESGTDPDWKSWRMPTTANPYIDPAEVEAARGDMPPAAFNQEFLGIPADDGGNPFGIDAIHACVGPLSEAAPVCFGVDLAKSHDWTVACGLDEAGNVCRLERWQSDWGQTRRRLMDLIADVPALVDSTGVGDPIVEDLIRECPRVEGFKFSSASKQQIMTGLVADTQRHTYTMPDGWLTAEMESFEYQYREGGVRYSAPEGLHDDGVCALALAREKFRRRSFNVLPIAEAEPVVVY
jgi:hypothetical protein